MGESPVRDDCRSTCGCGRELVGRDAVSDQFANHLRDLDHLRGSLDYGVTQIGDDQARSCSVAGLSGRGSTPARMASQVVHRQVGFSSTRT